MDVMLPDVGETGRRGRPFGWTINPEVSLVRMPRKTKKKKKAPDQPDHSLRNTNK
jgi:hypothetical protein